MKKREKPEPIYKTHDVFTKPEDFAGEEVRGSDGRLIYPGRVVRAPSFKHERWGTVPSRAGEVKRLFREEGKDRVIVETHNGHYLLAEQCRRSNARVESGTKIKSRNG